MLFHSIDFLIFFTIIFCVYYVVPHKFRAILLLCGSYFFYGYWKVEYLSLIILSTVIDYYAALRIESSQSPGKKKRFLLLSLIGNLSILFVFKYANFFIDSTQVVCQNLGLTYVIPHLNVLLPIGVSFYTFQSLSYTIDVYYGRRPAEKHFNIFALYVAFFPQLVAGPIERSTSLLPQFLKKIKFERKRVASGLKLVAWGFFKKLVVADRLAAIVDPVYSDPSQYNGAALILATFFFAFQIYFDFSGYSDTAIGLSRMLGFDLMQNFNCPYIASSIRGFWRRWHISLSTWFRDYLYIPLGGNKHRLYRNLIVTFLLCGMWHGANWTFFIWGVLHAVYICSAHLYGSFRNKNAGSIQKTESIPRRILRSVFIFSLVCIAWIFFRANNLNDAVLIFSRIFSYFGNLGSAILPFSQKQMIFWPDLSSHTAWHYISCLILIICTEVAEWYRLRFDVAGQIERLPDGVRIPLAYVTNFVIFLFFVIVLLGVFETEPFIYFQF